MAETKYKVLDISKYQPDVDYTKLSADGIGGVIIRAVSTNTAGLYIDPCFEKHYAGCKAAGIPVGAYFYTYAVTAADIDKEIDLFLKAIAGKKFEFPVYIDVEDRVQRKANRQTITNTIKYGLQRLENAGYYAAWYTFKNFFNNYIYRDQLTAFDLWLASWTSARPIRSLYNNYGMWQYTSDGSISAVAARVDLSYAYKDYPDIIKKNHLNGYTGEDDEPEPVPVPDHKEEIKTIIDTIEGKLQDIRNCLTKIKELL